MIMPGVQKPHCSAWFSWNACCTGCSLPSRARPSIVVTSPPSACTASTEQDFTLLPVEVHGAGAAVAGVAADDGAGLSEPFPQVVDEQHAGLDVVGVVHAVDGDPDLCHGLPPRRDRRSEHAPADTSGADGGAPHHTADHRACGATHRPLSAQVHARCGPATHLGSAAERVTRLRGRAPEVPSNAATGSRIAQTVGGVVRRRSVVSESDPSGGSSVGSAGAARHRPGAAARWCGAARRPTTGRRRRRGRRGGGPAGNAGRAGRSGPARHQSRTPLPSATAATVPRARREQSAATTASGQ